VLRVGEDGAVTDHQDATTSTVRDRLTSAGLSESRIAEHLDAGRVRLDGEMVTDLDAPALAGTRLVIWTK
jgi:hypothetical protein